MSVTTAGPLYITVYKRDEKFNGVVMIICLLLNYWIEKVIKSDLNENTILQIHMEEQLPDASIIVHFYIITSEDRI